MIRSNNDQVNIITYHYPCTLQLGKTSIIINNILKFSPWNFFMWFTVYRPRKDQQSVAVSLRQNEKYENKFLLSDNIDISNSSNPMRLSKHAPQQLSWLFQQRWVEFPESFWWLSLLQEDDSLGDLYN